MLPQITDKTTLLEFYRQLQQGCPVIDGKAVECVFTAAGSADRVFPHGMGRAWRGAWLMGVSAPATVAARVGTPATATSTPDLVPVSINAAADVTVTVWVW